MAEIIHDGFGWCRGSTNAGLLTPKWDVGTLSATAASIGPRFTGAGYFTISQAYLQKTFPAARQKLWVGFAHTVNTGVNRAFCQLFYLFDGATNQCMVKLNSNGGVEFRRGNEGATLITSSPDNTFSPQATTWDYYEFEIFLHGSTGYIKLWKNNALIWSVTGLNTIATANASATKIQFGTSVYGETHAMTDLYVVDDQAGGGPTTRVGDSRMICLLPSGAGDLAQWTPSAGSNYQTVDDAPANDDTDYVSSATVGQQDRYAFADLPAGLSGTIISVTHGYRARKDDAGVRQIAGNIRHNGTDAVGATHDLGSGYASYADTIFVDPDGGGALSVAVVNALQAGPDVIA